MKTESLHILTSEKDAWKTIILKETNMQKVWWKLWKAKNILLICSAKNYLVNMHRDFYVSMSWIYNCMNKN